MSFLEIIVVVAGLFLGYWLISTFMPGKPPSTTPSDSANQDSATEDAGRNDFSMPSWPDVLNVSPNASIEEIRRAYKTLIGQYHPDRVAALGEDLKVLAEHKTKEITQAYRDALQSLGAEV